MSSLRSAVSWQWLIPSDETAGDDSSDSRAAPFSAAPRVPGFTTVVHFPWDHAVSGVADDVPHEASVELEAGGGDALLVALLEFSEIREVVEDHNFAGHDAA